MACEEVQRLGSKKSFKRDQELKLWAWQQQVNVGPASASNVKKPKKGLLGKSQERKRYDEWEGLKDMSSDVARAKYIDMLRQINPTWVARKVYYTIPMEPGIRGESLSTPYMFLLHSRDLEKSLRVRAQPDRQLIIHTIKAFLQARKAKK